MKFGSGCVTNRAISYQQGVLQFPQRPQTRAFFEEG